MYHYTESGLSNVWLVNGYAEEQTPYGKGVRIDDAAGLHRSIATCLVNDKPHLTGAEIRFLREELDLSQAALAQIVGKDTQSVARWEKGRVPKMADRMIRFVYASYATGNADMKELIERLNDADQKTHERMRFRKAGRVWKPLAA
jgi:putative transcriptional regulator